MAHFLIRTIALLAGFMTVVWISRPKQIRHFLPNMFLYLCSRVNGAHLLVVIQLSRLNHSLLLYPWAIKTFSKIITDKWMTYANCILESYFCLNKNRPNCNYFCKYWNSDSVFCFFFMTVILLEVLNTQLFHQYPILVIFAVISFLAQRLCSRNLIYILLYIPFLVSKICFIIFLALLLQLFFISFIISSVVIN